MGYKRVVTKVDADGKAVFHEDVEIDVLEPAMFGGTQFRPVWGTEGEIASPQEPNPVPMPVFPGPGGTRFGIVTFPPDPKPGDPAPPAPTEEQVAEAQEQVPGFLDVLEPENPGMHTTRSMDYVVVLSGDGLYLELDDGAETHVPPGTCIVQNGTRHAWRNRGDGPATFAYVVMGTE
jgi:quercetin dioxygenase-like cupin family protein